MTCTGRLVNIADMRGPTIQRALISVSDKLGLIDFARGLLAVGVQLYSTGGTRRHLESERLPVADISQYTGFPEMMDGRLKTLHPKVFGGILCRHDHPTDMAAIDQHEILSFELVVVNLYPFEATIARGDVSVEEAIEQIDIGGPSLVRAAAKNHAFVTIATSPEQYSAILEEVAQDGTTSPELRTRLAGDAFTRTARYDQAIAQYFGQLSHKADFPPTVDLTLRRKQVLRYGENPHQPAALYSSQTTPGTNLLSSRQLHGKELSFNNLLDLDSSLTIARSLPHMATVVIKHTNPCGAASAVTLADATQKALDGDPESAFGSVLGMNRVVDAATADVLTAPGRFIEAIVAPGFDAESLQILTTRPKWKNNVRLVQVGNLEDLGRQRQFRFIDGGFLVQDADVLEDDEDLWKITTQARPNDQQMHDLRFAWAVVRHVKSNGIVLARDQALLGVGAGQMSRVDSVRIAIGKAASRSTGAVLGSDAFFPFEDSIHLAAEAGVVAIIQPGGSRRDDEVVTACDQHGIAMVITGRRHFKH